MNYSIPVATLSGTTNLYNRIVKVNIDYDEPLNNRAKLDTGTHCNYDCTFCYYKSELNNVTQFDVIKQRIDYLVACGITEVDLSGGESSIHRDWFKILDYCVEHGLHISTLSNGFRFADINFLRKSQEHGLKEILFSLHGYDEDSHNKIVGRPRGFKNIIRAIKNSNELGIIVRINCTITNDNYQHLDQFTKLVKQFNVREVNFLTLNYWKDAAKLQTIDYREVTPYIHKAIDQLKDTCIVNVRYTPFCFMKGYERHVCNTHQHIYDIYDWNIAVYDSKADPEEYRKDKHSVLFRTAKQNIINSYYKSKQCYQCKHFNICDGIEKQMSNVDIQPEQGDKILDVNFYRKGFYK